jgi:hypothetical protein
VLGRAGWGWRGVSRRVRRRVRRSGTGGFGSGRCRSWEWSAVESEPSVGGIVGSFGWGAARSGTPELRFLTLFGHAF